MNVETAAGLQKPGLEQREISRTLKLRPKPSKGAWLGVAAIPLLLACALAAWVYVSSRPIAVDSFVAVMAGLAGLVLAAVVGILAYGSRSMRYRLGSRELSISWLWTTEIVPLGRIDGVYAGQRLGKRARVEGVTWPGQYVGTARAEGLGRLRFYGTTSDPSCAIILATTHGAYAITPADLQGFRERLIERLESLPEDEMEGSPEPCTMAPRLLKLSLLRDGTAMGLLAVSVLVLLAAFGYVSARLPYLPELMPLHFNFAGEPDLVGPPRDAFRMPVSGLLVLGVNGLLAAVVHGWQRDAGRILVAATVFVELVMLIAVFRVVH